MLPMPAAEPSDQLKRRFAAGNPAAMEEMTAPFIAEVHRFCAMLLGNDDAALDALQETFLRVVERHLLFDPRRAFRPWLFTVARNCCLSAQRTSARRAAHVVDLHPVDGSAAESADSAPTALEELLRREREGEAMDALDGLSEERRAIVFLHLFQEMTFREVADVMELPAATVATTYYRSLKAMRATLERKSGAEQNRRRPPHAG